MNTLRDTDKRRARPSVWPVYVAAALLASLGLLGVAIGVEVLSVAPKAWWGWALFLMLVGALDAVVAYGLLRLRRWGWWGGIVCLCFGGMTPALRNALANPPTLLLRGVIIALIVGFIAWTLATRRRLFFPPTPEGEE